MSADVAISGYLVVLVPKRGTRYSGVDRVPAFPSEILREQQAMDNYVFGGIKDSESNLIPVLESAIDLQRSLNRGGRAYEIIHCNTSPTETPCSHLRVRVSQRLGYDVAAIRSDYWSVVDDLPSDEWTGPYSKMLNANGLFEARTDAESYLREYRSQLAADSDAPLEVVSVTRVVAR